MPSSAKVRFALVSYCLGMIILHVTLFWLVRKDAASASCDFSIFYTAGQMLKGGQAHALYDSQKQYRVQQEFVRQAFIRKGPLPFNHPPFEAILYWPLAYVAYFRAYVFWFCVNLGVLAATVYSIRVWLPELWGRFRLLFVVVPLAFFPIAYALMQGQDTILLVALYCLAYAALRRGQNLRAGIFLGLGLFKFHLVLPFIFILLLRRRWRVLLGTFLSGCLELLVSWGLVGWREILYYPRFVLEINRQLHRGVIVPENMPNLRGLLSGWPPFNPAGIGIQLVVALVSLVLLVWASRLWDPAATDDIRTWNRGFSIAMVATFLAGYHSYSYEMSIMLLPLLITLDQMLEPGARRDRTLQVTLGLMFFTPLQLVLMLHYSHQNLFALAVLGLLAALALSSVKTAPQAWANTSTTPSTALLR
jgi:hypothetical protein